MTKRSDCLSCPAYVLMREKDKDIERGRERERDREANGRERKKERDINKANNMYKDTVQC